MRAVIPCLEIIPLQWNTEIVDAYLNRIRQVEAMLGSGKPQILEVFKNTIPNRYFGLYSP